MERREQSPFVLGVRQDRNDAAHRLVVKYILKGLNLLIFGTYIRDANAPFRLMSTTFVQAALRGDFHAMSLPPTSSCHWSPQNCPSQSWRCRFSIFGAVPEPKASICQNLSASASAVQRNWTQFRLGFFHADCAQEERLHAQKNKSPRVGY